MGVEIDKSRFSESDYSTFQQLLRHETAGLKKLFDRDEFHNCGKSLGLEIEAWLVNEDFLPSPENDRFIATHGSPLVVPELSRFNLEINADPCELSDDVFQLFESRLRRQWQQIQATASRMSRRMLTIGSLPTLRDEMLTVKYMSDLERYRAFNHEVLRMRQNIPVVMDIEGYDHLKTSHDDIMIEAAATSFQIHFQVEPELAHLYYNASLVASPAMVAVAANTPYLFGKDLWEETRIPVFEQSLDLPGFRMLDGNTVKRVTFGSGYLRDSMLEVFLENLSGFPPLLPVIDHSAEYLDHVRLHNGSIWRWNRPIIGRCRGGMTLRTEHRVPSAGPTVVDMVANMSFYVGLTHGIVHRYQDLAASFPFSKLVQSFYSAARKGLASQVERAEGRGADMQQLLFEELLPLARDGLVDLGVCEQDIRKYIDDVIYNRVLCGQTGSRWQRSWIATHGPDFQGMTQAYFEMQETQRPVHQWEV